MNTSSNQNEFQVCYIQNSVTLDIQLKVAVSLYHYAIKFPTPQGIGDVKGSREPIERCQLKAYTSHQCTPRGVHMAAHGNPNSVH